MTDRRRHAHPGLWAWHPVLVSELPIVTIVGTHGAAGGCTIYQGEEGQNYGHRS
jgi:hypothetical protein